MQAVRREVHGVFAADRGHGAGDAGPGPRVPPAVLRVRQLRAAAAEGRAVRAAGGKAVLQAGLREGDAAHADSHTRYWPFYLYVH